jgi:hypothetical protein
MKTVTSEQVIEKFDEYSKLAHGGERVLVTLDGKPWVVLAAPSFPLGEGQSPTRLTWPDFAARLAPHYLEPTNGPTASELLARDKEDRF